MFGQGAFLNGVTNAGTITAASSAAQGVVIGEIIVVRSLGAISLSTFSGGVTNSGKIGAGGHGIVIGLVGAAGTSNTSNSVAISTFSGGIKNSGTVTSGGIGIAVGVPIGAFGNSVSVNSFGGGIVNSAGGVITAGSHGILVGGAGSAAGSTITVSNFTGGILNAGLINAAGKGIYVGGSATGATLVISTFAGGITNTGKIVAVTGIAVNNAVQTFTGAISNSGTISGTGGIAIDVSGANNAIIINQSAGLISGAIKLSANADVLNITGGVVNGNIVGGNAAAGGNTVNFSPGSGNTFTYANNFTTINQVNVVSGTVVINGAGNSATAMTVSNAGTLAGTGTITTAMSILAGGTLQPGTPGTAGGTLHITGNLVFNAAAFYMVTINGASVSKTVASGTATLGGASVKVATGSTVTNGTPYTILTAGSLSGAFAGSVTYNGQTGTVSNSGSNVILTFNGGSSSPGSSPGSSSGSSSGSTPGSTPGSTTTPTLLSLLPPGAPGNDVNVAKAIDAFVASGGTLPAGFQNLFTLSGLQLVGALTIIDGELASAAEKGAFNLMDEFLLAMLDPSADGRTDSAGSSQFAAEGEQGFPAEVALAYAGVMKGSQKSPTFDQRWTAWGSAFGGYNKTDGNANVGSNTVTSRDYGFAGGMDYHVSRDTTVGFALAGSGLNWGLAQGLGTGRSVAFQAGVYGKTYFGPAYIAAALAYTDNWMTTNRTALGDQLTARFMGQSYGGRFESGYRIGSLAPAALGVTPYAAIQTQWFHTPSYRETDLTGGGFGVSSAAMTANDTRSELGARFDDRTLLYNMPLLLRARLAYAHDWVTSSTLNGSFQSLPGTSFTVNGAKTPANSAVTSFGGELRMTPQWSVAAKFDGEFASGSQTYAGTGMLKYTW